VSLVGAQIAVQGLAAGQSTYERGPKAPLY